MLFSSLCAYFVQAKGIIDILQEKVPDIDRPAAIPVDQRGRGIFDDDILARGFLFYLSVKLPADDLGYFTVNG